MSYGARCPTCRAAESNARATLESEYAPQLANGEVIWTVLDYMQDPAAQAMAAQFDVATATIVLVKMKGGDIEVWNRLDRVLSLAADKPALSEYLCQEINEMLPAPDRGPAPSQPDAVPAVAAPDDAADGPPVPTDPAEIPLPE